MTARNAADQNLLMEETVVQKVERDAAKIREADTFHRTSVRRKLEVRPWHKILRCCACAARLKSPTC